MNEPNNLEARGAMQIASCMAGVAFNKGLGLVHSISHSIGAEYGQHHGLINAITLPAVLQIQRASHILQVRRNCELPQCRRF